MYPTDLPKSAMGLTPEEFTCVSRFEHPHGHLYSCNRLHSLGVWVGFLAPDKQHLSFKGLPSFKQLKKNCSRFVRPYPPSIPGVAGAMRSAVCRGCIHKASQLLTLEEIGFVKNTKLVIMRLDGEDEDGMFCILLPQANDRALQGVQSYRPYEYEDDGSGKFTSNVMFLTLRNTSQPSSIVLDTVRSVLGIPMPDLDGTEDDCYASPLPPRMSNRGSNSLTSTRTSVTPGTRKHYRESSDERLSKRRRQETPFNYSPQPPTLASRGTSEILANIDSMAFSPGLPTPMKEVLRFPGDCKFLTDIQTSLTDKQAKFVRLVWIVKVDDVEYDFSHSLASCATLSTYFDLLREDAADSPEILAKIENSRVWRLSYQLPGLSKKAFAVRLEDETGFERLLQSLAQSLCWDPLPDSKIDVQLQVLK